MRSRLCVLAGVVLLSGCIDKLNVPGQLDYAVVEIDGAADPANAGTSITSPFAQVFMTSNFTLPIASSAQDQCRILPYSTALPTGLVGTPLNPGTPFTLALSGNNESLVRTVRSNGAVFWTSPSFTYLPGDSVTVVVPGSDSFPAVSLRTKTAESFDYAGVLVPTDGSDSLNLTWTPKQEEGSAMIVSLRYNALPSDPLNQQIYCTFFDDGQAAIPAAAMTGWRAADLHEAMFERLRTAGQRNNAALLYIISTYSVSKPVP